MAPAGDQDQAAAGAGQQRSDLLAAGRVVQHQQQLLTRQPVSPQRHPRFCAGRDLRGGEPGGQQQAGQRVGRVHRLLAGGVPVQRQEDLPAREPVRELVRGVHRERGLADPGHPPDRVDTHHPAPPGCGLRQLREFLLPPGERGDIAGQRPHRRHPASPGPARFAAPRHRLDLRPGRADQLQRVGQQPDRIPVGRHGDAPLQITDRPRAQARRLRELLLRQPGLGAQLPQQAGEGNRRLGHTASPHPQTGATHTEHTAQTGRRLRPALAGPSALPDGHPCGVSPACRPLPIHGPPSAPPRSAGIQRNSVTFPVGLHVW